MQLAVQCKMCPVCNGAGTTDPANLLPKKRKEFACENCQGQRYVPLVTCRGCGRAALEWDAEVPYCGRKCCWERLVEVIDPNKPVHRGSYTPAGTVFPFGPGVRVTDHRRFHAANGQIWDPFKNEYVDSIDLQNRGDGLSPEQEASIARAMAFGWCSDCE